MVSTADGKRRLRAIAATTHHSATESAFPPVLGTFRNEDSPRRSSGDIDAFEPCAPLMDQAQATDTIHYRCIYPRHRRDQNLGIASRGPSYRGIDHAESHARNSLLNETLDRTETRSRQHDGR